jgi:D-amino peptidase
MARKKLLLISDLAGVAGVTTFADVEPDGRYFERSKYLLTGEINAAVFGILPAIEAEIFVLDAFPAGGINFEELHPEIKLIAGKDVFRNFTFENFTAVLFVGQHARNGVNRAHLNHTLERDEIVSVSLNGLSLGEFGLWAGYAGQWNIPTIFLAGDTAACEEASELVLNITTVAVKEGLDRETAIHLTHPKAVERIQKGAEDAVKNLANVKPLVFAPPFEVVVAYQTTGRARKMAFEKQGKLVNPQTVSFSFQEYSDVVRLWI